MISCNSAGCWKSATLALTWLVGCGGDDANIVALDQDARETLGGDAPASGNGAATHPAYLLMHTVSSPEGRQNYVLATPTLEIGEFDERQALEVSGASRSFTLGGAAFVGRRRGARHPPLRGRRAEPPGAIGQRQLCQLRHHLLRHRLHP